MKYDLTYSTRVTSNTGVKTVSTQTHEKALINVSRAEIDATVKLLKDRAHQQSVPGFLLLEVIDVKITPSTGGLQ